MTDGISADGMELLRRTRNTFGGKTTLGPFTNAHKRVVVEGLEKGGYLEQVSGGFLGMFPVYRIISAGDRAIFKYEDSL